ncbi:hypothetical protein [Leucobacter coleopterorum]|uniref:hypothetical protein n=1 Tax=Leucobacter coleopterorum TaxID=2714933 RepID=UPI001FCAC3B4|nr:hypothetical protein [Leucobacter coleopterorum]
MTREHLRPVLLPSYSFDWLIGSDEPGASHRIAQETSWALLDRVRKGADPVIVERVVQLASGDGINDIAELWARQGAHSLAGVLWRLYLLRRVAGTDPELTADLYRRGAVIAVTIDPVVAGVAEPATPASITELCDTILRGAFTGDLGDALERAASYCRIMSLGPPTSPTRAITTTTSTRPHSPQGPCDTQLSPTICMVVPRAGATARWSSWAVVDPALNS